MKKLGLLSLMILAFAMTATADIPKTIHFQGRLTDISGNPVVDGTYGIIFNIWDVETGGTTPLWSSNYSVPIKDGFYSVELGSGSIAFPPAMTFDQPYWLDLQVSGDPNVMSPRIKLNAAAYAMNVADGAIKEAKLATDAVTTSKIKASAVTTDKLQDGAATTAKIADNAVIKQKIASNAIDSSKIQDGTIATQDLADASVNQAKAPGAVFTAKWNTMLESGSVSFSGSEFSSGVLSKTFNFTQNFTNPPVVMAVHASGDFTDAYIVNVLARSDSKDGGHISLRCNTKPTGGSVWINWIAFGD